MLHLSWGSEKWYTIVLVYLFYIYLFIYFHAQCLHVFGIFFSFYIGCLVRITFLHIVICLPTAGVLSSLHRDFAISLKASCPDMSKLKNITVTSGNMKSVHQEILVCFFHTYYSLSYCIKWNLFLCFSPSPVCQDRS